MCPCPGLLAQSPGVAFKHLTVDDGLPQNCVTEIFQDHLGYIWFGTLDGLVKYDGYDFKTFKHEPRDTASLSYNAISAIAEDRQGFLWVGTDRELNRLDPWTEEFQAYDLGITNSVYVDRRGRVWVGTSEGLFWYDRSRDRFVNSLKQLGIKERLVVGPICEPWRAEGDILWFGTYRRGLFRFDVKNQTWQRFSRDPLNPGSLGSQEIYALAADSSGALWIGTRNDGLDRLDLEELSLSNGTTPEFRHFRHNPSDPQSISRNSLRSIIYDPEQHVLWLATQKKGLDCFDIQTEGVSHFRHDPDNPASPPSDNLCAVYKDRHGTIWAGTLGSGVTRFQLKCTTFRNISYSPDAGKSLNHRDVWSIYEDSCGCVWIGTDTGITKIPGGQNSGWRHYDVRPNDSRTLPVRAILEDRPGRLVIGTLGGGLFYFDEQTEKLKQYPLDRSRPDAFPNPNIYTIFKDRSDVIWIGTNGNGLVRFNRATQDFTTFRSYGNHTDRTIGWVTSIHQDRAGELWVGTWSNGLLRFDPPTQRFEPEEAHRTRHNAVGHYGILTIHEDASGTLWLGTYGKGLIRLPPDREGAKTYTEEDGLPNNVIYALLEDDLGCLWLSTNYGLSRFDPSTEHFRNFDISDGLQSNEFNLGAAMKSRAGELFFGGVSGLTRFYPGDIINTTPPDVLITGFKKFGKSITLDVPLWERERLNLSYQDRVLAFEFVAFHSEAPEENSYAYKLEGFDKTWHHVGSKREAIYTNLDPGDYVFKVKAANSDAVWNETAASLTVSISPPFWRSTWFTIAVIGLSLLTGAGLYRYRISAIRRIERARFAEREQVRTEIAKDFHDELGHRLSRIAVSSKRLLSLTPENRRRLEQDLESIGRNADEILKEVRGFIWEIDPQRNTILELAIALKNFSDQLFDDTPIAFEITGLQPEIESIVTPLKWRQHLFRIFKEAIHNVFKHADGTTHVVLQFKLRKGWLEIVLKDNGCGFSAKQPHAGQGLQNMQERAQGIGCELQIQSMPGQGTTVHFKGKLS